MATLPKAREVVRVARKLGFYFSRQKGGHAIYRHNDSRRITIPVHGGKEIGPAVLGDALAPAPFSPAMDLPDFSKIFHPRSISAFGG